MRGKPKFLKKIKKNKKKTRPPFHISGFTLPVTTNPFHTLFLHSIIFLSLGATWPDDANLA